MLSMLLLALSILSAPVHAGLRRDKVKPTAIVLIIDGFESDPDFANRKDSEYIAAALEIADALDLCRLMTAGIKERNRIDVIGCARVSPHQVGWDRREVGDREELGVSEPLVFPVPPDGAAVVVGPHQPDLVLLVGRLQITERLDVFQSLMLAPTPQPVVATSTATVAWNNRSGKLDSVHHEAGVAPIVRWMRTGPEPEAIEGAIWNMAIRAGRHLSHPEAGQATTTTVSISSKPVDALN